MRSLSWRQTNILLTIWTWAQIVKSFASSRFSIKVGLMNIDQNTFILFKSLFILVFILKLEIIDFVLKELFEILFIFQLGWTQTKNGSEVKFTWLVWEFTFRSVFRNSFLHAFNIFNWFAMLFKNLWMNRSWSKSMVGRILMRKRCPGNFDFVILGKFFNSVDILFESSDYFIVKLSSIFQIN